MRLALDPKKPITTLRWPEFYDVKVTSQCSGACPYCYQCSVSDARHHRGLVARFRSFFGSMTDNQKPFQIAFGGGEPTGHPEFSDLMRECSLLGITPNYTTNGMWRCPSSVMRTTREHCGGVAISTHQHLEKHWRAALAMLLNAGVHTNLHVIIGGRRSIDEFARIYKEFSGKVKYFVLLPLAAQGRSTERFCDWDYLTSRIDGSPRDVAFGANFHPYLQRDRSRFRVSIYDPESMSAYLDLETMDVFKSSFSNERREIGNPDDSDRRHP